MAELIYDKEDDEKKIWRVRLENNEDKRYNR